MHLREFEKTWREYKLVLPDGQSQFLVKIFWLEDNTDPNIRHGGLELVQDVFLFELKHILKTKFENEKILLLRLLKIDRGDTTWEIVGELVKLDQAELESLTTSKFKSLKNNPSTSS